MAHANAPAAAKLNPTLVRAIARARGRIRLQRTLNGSTLALIPATALLLVFLVLYKMYEIDRDTLLAGVLGAAGVLFAGFLWGLLRTVPVSQAARLLDARADLADRLGSAWDFVHSRERTEFMDAAIRDAAQHAHGLPVAKLIRLSTPRDLPVALLLAVSVIVLILLRFPPPAGEVGPGDTGRPAAPPPPMVPPFQAMLAREKLAETRKEAERAKVPEAKKLLEKIDRLWQQIQSRQIDKRDLWKKLAALQQKKLTGLSGEDREELGRLQKMGESIKKNKVGERLSDALKRGDLARAQEALRELARRLQDKQLTKKERKELERMLKQADEKNQKEMASLRRKLEKLQKELRKRELQKLAKDKKERELQRLSRELEKLQSMLSTQLSQELMEALKQMKRYADQDAGQRLQKASERMQQLMKRIRQLKMLARAQDHIKEMKDLLRRGPQQERDEQMREFHLRAGGGGEGDLTVMLPGQGKQGQGGQKPGQCSQCGGGHPTSEHGGKSLKPAGQEPGKGIGTGTDMRLGNPTSIQAKHVESRLTGKKGRGDVQSEIFTGAATKGFSRVGYRNVYLKYREVVEEALEKNKGIPPGYKRIVEKYFEMIRPK